MFTTELSVADTTSFRPKPGEQAGEIMVHVRKDINPRWCRQIPFAHVLASALPLGQYPSWLLVLRDSFRHIPFWLEAIRAGRRAGFLPLAHVRSPLFGRFLVSLPYLNSAGVFAEDACAAAALIDRAVQLADELDVRYLELRHETEHFHPALTHQLTHKVHMRRSLPATAAELFKLFDPKVRNQIRKAEKQQLTVQWGGQTLLSAFYDVFSRNMRDLGTPVYSVRLFENILQQFPIAAELCVVCLDRKPIAGALVIHGAGVTEVPSASSLRAYNTSCANMLLYWHLLQRAIQRGQHTFDFGRSTHGSNTYAFKKQWGACAQPAVWQYYLRKGAADAVRPESGNFDLSIRTWQRLPVWVTRLIGPFISRGIP